MNKRRAILPELLKNAIAFFLLLAVTLLLLQLPRIYYQKQDEQLLQEVSTLPYSVKMGSEKMTFEQKLTALISDDILLTTDEEPFYANEQFDIIWDNLEKQFASLLPSFWSDQLSSFRNPRFLDYVGKNIQIVQTQVFQVIDNKTYSFHLNQLQYDFYMDDCFYRGIVLFDSDDYKIFLMNLEHVPLEYDVQIDESYFYEVFPPKENAMQLTDYYKDLSGTDFQPTCEYSPVSLILCAFSPYNMNNTLSKELEDLFTQYQQIAEDGL